MTRERVPYVILVEFDDRNHTIRALSLFDIIQKRIVQLEPSVFRKVQNCHYLGSSHGCLFVGRFIEEALHITLLNPFANEPPINLPALNCQPTGIVLLSERPTSVRNDHMTVVYCPRSDGRFLLQARFIRLTANSDWQNIWFTGIPDDVLAMEGQFYVNFKGILRKMDVENHGLYEEKFTLLLPGLPRSQSSDPTLNLRYFQDLEGHLHLLVCSSYQSGLYAFTKVCPMQYMSLFYDERFLAPPRSLGIKRHIVFLDDLTVKTRFGRVLVDNYYSQNLLLKLSAFWGTDQNRFQPVGWIASSLL